MEEAVWHSLLCVWAIQALDALDGSIVAPAMAAYMAELGGSRQLYGAAVSLFWLGRLALLPVFGYWADHHSFRGAFSVALVLGFAGGVLYASAGLSRQVWIIPLSRLVLGGSAGVVSALMAFTASSVAHDKQTRYLGLQQMVFNVVTMLSPALATGFAVLPGVPGVVDQFTYCGYFIAFANLVCLVALRRHFTEPARSTGGLLESETGLLSNQHRAASSAHASIVFEAASVFRHIAASGAWISFLLSIQNNFNQTLVQWSLPLVSQDLFGWSQKQNGFLFALLGLVGLSATMLVVWLVARYSILDRKIILYFQVLVGLALVLFAVFFTCGEGQRAPVPFVLCSMLWAFGSFGQIPGNIGLFAKLVGKREQGAFQAVLFMAMSASRALAGVLIGQAGSCTSWSFAGCFWAAQMLVFLPYYGRLDTSSGWARIDPRGEIGSSEACERLGSSEAAGREYSTMNVFD